jgi:hypothetical protein
MKLIGSGTIAQVYKIGDKCIKVRHPNVASEIMEAVRMYDSVKNMFFMPVALKMVCDTFFEGLVVQLDFHKEFENGKLFKELAHGGTDGTNNLLIIPRMLDTSDECLVMEYEPSQSIVLSERDKIDKHTLLRACYCMSVFGNLNWTIEMMHLDPHFGNFGIRDDKLVIYDFGLMVDIRKTNFNRMLKSKYVYDIDILINLLNLAPHHEIGLRLALGYVEKGNSIQFCDCFPKITSYIVIHGILLDKKLTAILDSNKYYKAILDICGDLEKDKEYRYYVDHIEQKGWLSFYDTYFKYDDIRVLRDRTIKILSD